MTHIKILKMNDLQEISSALLEKITYGFYIATTRKDHRELSTRERDYIAAGTVSWVMQCSFEPPMVAVAIAKGSDLHETVGRSEVFALHILGKDDRELIDAFARDSAVRDQKINGYPFLNGMKTQCPVLDRGIGYLECEVREMIVHPGDHVLFLGEVVGSKVHRPEAMPLHEWETGKHYGGLK